jgi:uracil-DNA glycosylase
MVRLRARMQEHLADWRDDLTYPWQFFFADSPPLDFLGIPEALQIDDNALVWPGRKPQGIDALVASHICRAFDGIAPDNVRVVVLGLDPYPSRAQATGRAFEDGNWDSRTESLARSLKPLMLAALATREGHGNLFRAGSWREVRRQIADQDLEFPALDAYFDNLARQGVLFVNAAWTHTIPGDIHRHLALWEPVVHHLLRKLARGAEDPLVFLLLGRDAQTVFTASGAEAEDENGGVEGNHIVRVDLPHPSRPAAFYRQNPWLSVNENLGAPHIDWWP